MFEDESHIEVEPDLEGRVVVIVHGSLDLPEVGPFRDILNEICAEDYPAIVVDLTHVTFIGSSGMGVLLHAKQKVDELDRSLVLRGAGASIRRAFEITGLDQVLEFEEPV